MSQLILVGKSEARRAYSQDFWSLEEAVGDSDTWFLPVHRVGGVHSRVLGRTGVQEGLFTTRLGTGEAESLNSWGSRMDSLGDSEFWVAEESSTYVCVRYDIDALKGLEKRIEISESQGGGK